jgi:hypothetical protein
MGSSPASDTPSPPDPMNGTRSSVPQLPGTPRHGRHSGRRVQALVAALVVVFLLSIGLGLYPWFLPGANCNDWWVSCPGGPGETPLGSTLGIGNGTGACAAGNGSSTSDCAYTFALKIQPSGQPPTTVPSARDLSFDLLNSVDTSLGSTFLVTLADPVGSWIGTWNSSSSTWASSNGSGSCGGSNCLSAPLQIGDSLLLRSIPFGGLPYTHQGDRLLAKAVGGGFSGTVDAPID